MCTVSCNGSVITDLFVLPLPLLGIIVPVFVCFLFVLGIIPVAILVGMAHCTVYRNLGNWD
jgi:hypothetical protein